jgi:hypothetical protein
MVGIISVSNPEYVNLENTAINCDVVFNDGNGDLPSMRYTAMASDSEVHGQTLWANLQNGDYGAIAPYSAPVLTVDDYKENLKEIRLEKQSSGVTISGATFTDKSGNTQTSGVLFKADNNTLRDMDIKAGRISPVIKWKCSDGEFRGYSISEFARVNAVVVVFNQDCFDNEAAKINELEAATDPSTVDLNAGWPSNAINL